MKGANKNDLRIEEILSEKGSLRHDGKPLVSNASAFNVKEFTFIFYGSSRDKRSRQVAAQLNSYVDCFNPEDQGLRKESKP